MSLELPDVDFGGIKLPRIILGCDPFSCYTAFYPNPREKEETYSNNFSNADTTMEIVHTAIKLGFNALHFSCHKNVINVVEKIIENNLDVKLIPLVFRVPLEIRSESVSIARTEATVFQHLMDLLRNQEVYRELVQTRIFKAKESAPPLRQTEMDDLKVDNEKLENVLKWYAEKGSVKLATTCVEFFTAVNRLDLLEEAIDTFDSLGFTVCAGAHTAEAFEILEKEKIRFEAYFAPLNKIGFFMLPTQERMLESLSRISEPFIAIKPLAGGRLKPQEALSHIFDLKKNAVCMMGLSSVEEVEEAFHALSKIAAQ